MLCDLRLRFQQPKPEAAIPSPAVELEKGKVCAGTQAGRALPAALAQRPKHVIVYYTIMVIVVLSVVTQMLLRLLTPAPLPFRITKRPLKIKCFYGVGGRRGKRRLQRNKIQSRSATRNRKTLIFYIVILLLRYLEGIINRRKFLFCGYITLQSNFSLT